MKINIQTFTIISLVIINIVLLKLFMNLRDDNEIKMVSMDRETMKQFVITFIKRNNSSIDYYQRIVCENLDTIALQDIIDDNTIVFFFNESNCLPCINKTIDLIESKAKEYGISNIAILSQVKSYNELRVLKETNDISLNVYQMIDLESDLSNLHIPLLFVLDEKLIMNNVLPIFPGYSDITELYLNRVLTSQFIQ